MTVTCIGHCSTHTHTLTNVPLFCCSLQTRISDLSHHNEILAMDKQFLTKELESVMQKADANQRELDRTHEKVRDLKRRKEELMQQLADVREQAKVSYEDKLGKVSKGPLIMCI